MDGEVIEARIRSHATIEDVNVHLLDKLDELIDDIKKLTWQMDLEL